jgi:hypothetical protein
MKAIASIVLLLAFASPALAGEGPKSNAAQQYIDDCKSIGYPLVYIQAVRDLYEGSAFCTKSVPDIEIVQSIGQYNQKNDIPKGMSALTIANIKAALRENYPCLSQKK